ncbi:MAG: PAS domain-containing protein [Thalassobaculaceae bacterium]|nr:PAS domain-containing protein [Thalassobaculaceae bacterium]
MLDRISRSRSLSALLSIWQAAQTEAGASALPRRSAIDPIDLAAAGLLPTLMMVGRGEDGCFRYRLVGERIREAMQIRMAGASLLEVHPDGLDRFVHDRYVAIIERGCVEYSAGEFLRIADCWHEAERLILPLAGDDGVAAFAIGIIEPGHFRRLADSGDDPRANYTAFDVFPWQHLTNDGAELG